MGEKPAEERPGLLFLGPVYDVAHLGIGIVALRYSGGIPPGFVFVLPDAQSEWEQHRIN